MDIKRKIQISMLKGHKYRIKSFLLYFDGAIDRFVFLEDGRETPIEITKLWMICEDFVKVTHFSIDQKATYKRRVAKRYIAFIQKEILA